MYDGLIAIPCSAANDSEAARQLDATASEVGRVEGMAPRTFFSGPENALAASAVRATLETTPPRFNPLVFYGQPGTGKSHLALGIAREFESRAAGQIVCLSAADFARQLAAARQAAQAGDMTNLLELRQRIRGAILFVLEDLTQLASRPAAQQELINTLDELIAEDRQVVITLRTPPRDVAKLLPSLVARLTGGLEVPLVAPGAVARAAILEQLARERDIELPEDAAHVLAEGLAATAPQLAGVLVELHTACRLENAPITAPRARKYLGRRPASATNVRSIATATARYFGLKVSDLTSPSRRRGIVLARGVAVYLARQLTGKSLEQLGKHFGGRDHTTVLHGYRTTEERLQSDPATRRAVADVRKMLLPA